MLAMTTSSPAICPALPAYAELHCRSNFSFQIGASHAEELVERAHALGYSALAVTDECSVAGLVRAHGEARKRGLKLIAGAEFVLEDGAPPDAAADTGPDGAAVPAARWRVVALARDRRGWGQLCSFITACRRAAPKGHYRVGWERPHRRPAGGVRDSPGARSADAKRYHNRSTPELSHAG
jgi:error-prone DNA polymerase